MQEFAFLLSTFTKLYYKTSSSKLQISNLLCASIHKYKVLHIHSEYSFLNKLFSLMHVDMVQNLQTLPWSLPTRVQVSDVNQIFALLDYLIGSQVYSTHCQITLINQSEI